MTRAERRLPSERGTSSAPKSQPPEGSPGRDRPATGAGGVALWQTPRALAESEPLLSKPFATQPYRAPAQITSADVSAEHAAALLSLTPEQRRAIQRLQQAKQHSHFNGRYPEENLKAIFEKEAAKRSKADDDAP